MVKKFLKIAGVKNEQEFYKKYPTESAFFKAHPEAKTLAKMTQGGYINKALPFVPDAPVMYAQGGVLPMYQQDGFVGPKPSYGMVGPQQQFGMVGPQQSYGMVGPHIPLPAYTPKPQEPDYGMTGPVQQFGMAGTSRPASTYTGTSVVDYLKSMKLSSDKESRRKLAESKGIKNYTGNYDQNVALLDILRGGKVLNNRAEINNIYAQGGETPDGRALVNAYAEGGGYPYIGIPYHNYDMPMAYAYGGMYQMGGAPQQVDGQAQQSQGGGGQDQQIAQVVMQRLQEQEQPEQILKDLVKAGVDDKKAVAIVQAVMQQMQQAGGGQQQMQMAQYGGAMYQSGGYVAGQEYDLDDEEIQRLKSLGYGVEYRD